MVRLKTIDAHAAGEPLRLIVDGFPSPVGKTMLAKREWVRQHADELRRALMLEPRGHADMYGAILTEPVSPGSHAGVLFMHNEGYSTMCGHGVVAVDLIGDEVDGLGACRHYPVEFPAVQADFHALPFEPAQFDLVVFGASLHYARDPEKALAEARRMLGAAGAIVIMDSPVVAVPRMSEAMGLHSRFFESRGPLGSRFRRFFSSLSHDSRPRPYGVWVIA